jgi:hypothetical protein
MWFMRFSGYSIFIHMEINSPQRRKERKERKVFNGYQKRISLRSFGNCSLHYSNSCLPAVVRLCGENPIY